MSKRPYEYVDEAIRLADAGKIDRAEAAFKKGVEAYQRHEPEGLSFALGRLGAFYIEQGRPDDALPVLRKAVTAWDPPPAVFADLCGLLADRRELDEIFRTLDAWRHNEQERVKRWEDVRDQAQLDRQLEGPAWCALGLASRQAGKGDLAATLPFLDRLLPGLRGQGMEDAYWQARGLTGSAYEQAGDVEAALTHYSQAIEEGSTDRKTFTRLLINLEKRKEYQQALAVCDRATALNPDANWLLDLRKRRARLEPKAQGGKPRGKEVIPEFVVRAGADLINLKLQQKVSPMPQHFALHRGSGLAFLSQGGKTPRLSAHAIADGEIRWTVACDVSGLALGGDTLLAWTRNAPIGAGPTSLSFYDLSGALRATTSIPDAISQVAGHTRGFYLGCRNGALYSFGVDGRRLWEYPVPGSQGKFDSPYLRPCPYYVGTSQEGTFAVYSSFAMVEAIDASGKRRWHWEASEKSSKERVSSGGITIEVSISAGSPLVRSLAVAPDGSGLLVTAGDDVVWLDGQSGKARPVASPKETSQAWLGAPGSNNVIFLSRDGLRIFKAGKNAGALSGLGYVTQVAHHPERPLYAICHRRDCWLVDGDGKKPVHLEFARDPVGVDFAGSLLVVAAGSLILIDAQKVLDAPSPSRRPKPQVEPAIPMLEAQAPPEPTGITPERPSVGPRLTERTLPGRRSPVPSKGKALYINRGGGEVLIEQLALGYYREQGYAGLWSENDYWWQVMTLLYWDVVFARLPNVYDPRLGEFPSRLQDIPRDIFSAEFYARRKTMIAARHEALSSRGVLGLGSTSPEQELRKAWGRHRGKTCRFFDKWQKFSVDDLALATRVLRHEQLVMIMTRLLQDFNANRKGLPDLFLVKGSEPLFVEVKGEREKVDPAQQAWHEYLVQRAGLSVVICRVVVAQGRRIGRQRHAHPRPSARSRSQRRASHTHHATAFPESSRQDAVAQASLYEKASPNSFFPALRKRSLRWSSMVKYVTCHPSFARRTTSSTSRSRRTQSECWNASSRMRKSGWPPASIEAKPIRTASKTCSWAPVLKPGSG